MRRPPMTAWVKHKALDSMRNHSGGHNADSAVGLTIQED